MSGSSAVPFSAISCSILATLSLIAFAILPGCSVPRVHFDLGSLCDPTHGSQRHLSRVHALAVRRGSVPFSATALVLARTDPRDPRDSKPQH